MKIDSSYNDSVEYIICRNDDDTILCQFDVDSYMPCSALNFYVNGTEADEDDFCDYDITGNCEECTCCYHKIPFENPSQELLDKYKITSEQYKDIANLLKEYCDVDGCGRCL